MEASAIPTEGENPIKTELFRHRKKSAIPTEVRSACVPFGGIGVDSRRPQAKISSDRSPPSIFGRLGSSPNHGRNIVAALEPKSHLI